MSDNSLSSRLRPESGVWRLVGSSAQDTRISNTPPSHTHPKMGPKPQAPAAGGVARPASLRQALFSLDTGLGLHIYSMFLSCGASVHRRSRTPSLDLKPYPVATVVGTHWQDWRPEDSAERRMSRRGPFFSAGKVRSKNGEYNRKQKKEGFRSGFNGLPRFSGHVRLNRV